MAEALTQLSYKDWHIPFEDDQITLADAYNSMQLIRAEQHEIPLMVQLVENPKYSFPGVNIFHGAVDLKQHDFIHIILGRGLLEKDEAFTIGFTMGSTNKVSSTEEKLYSFISKYLYPNVYQFKDEEIDIFKHAVRLACICNCQALDEVNFNKMVNEKLCDIRSQIKIEKDLILAYYKIEKRRYPGSLASQRLV